MVGLNGLSIRVERLGMTADVSLLTLSNTINGNLMHRRTQSIYTSGSNVAVLASSISNCS